MSEKAKRDWSMLDSQIVGSEVLPTANWEKVETLKKENATLKAQNERLVKAFRYVLYHRLPLGDKVIETLSEHWQNEAKAALEETKL